MSETQIGKEAPKKVPPEMVKKSLVGQVGLVALVVGILFGWIITHTNEKALTEQNFSLKQKLEVAEGNFGVCTANFSKLVGTIPHTAEINFTPVMNEIEKNCGPKKVVRSTSVIKRNEVVVPKHNHKIILPQTPMFPRITNSSVQPEECRWRSDGTLRLASAPSVVLKRGTVLAVTVFDKENPDAPIIGLKSGESCNVWATRVEKKFGKLD